MEQVTHLRRFDQAKRDGHFGTGGVLLQEQPIVGQCQYAFICLTEIAYGFTGNCKQDTRLTAGAAATATVQHVLISTDRGRVVRLDFDNASRIFVDRVRP